MDKKIGESEYPCRRRGTIIQKVSGLGKEKVEDILNKLEADNLIRKAPFKAQDDDDLYGLTTRVGKRP